jgi:hypothetical protein
MDHPSWMALHRPYQIAVTELGQKVTRFLMDSHHVFLVIFETAAMNYQVRIRLEHLKHDCPIEPISGGDHYPLEHCDCLQQSY